MAERFPDFEIQEIQELKENLENQNAKKSTLTWPMSGPAWPKTRTSPKTNVLPYEAKQLDENKQMALHH